MCQDNMTAERAVYYKLFLELGLTENFDRMMDEHLAQEAPLSDLTLELATCAGKKEKQLHILNEYILETHPERIDKSEVFSLVADELRERYENDPDCDMEEFTLLMHDLAKNSDWWEQKEPWTTMYDINLFYDEAFQDQIMSKALFWRIFRRLLYNKIGTDLVRIVIRRKCSFAGALVSERIFINGLPVGTLPVGGRIESEVLKAKAYYLESNCGDTVLRDSEEGYYELTCKMQGGWRTPARLCFSRKTERGEVPLPPLDTQKLDAAIELGKPETLSKPEQTLAFCREFMNGVAEDMDGIFSSPYIHRMAESLHEIGAAEYEAFLRHWIEQFSDIALPLSDDQLDSMRKRINDANREETKIEKTAFPELREAMALYFVENLF